MKHICRTPTYHKTKNDKHQRRLLVPCPSGLLSGQMWQGHYGKIIKAYTSRARHQGSIIYGMTHVSLSAMFICQFVARGIINHWLLHLTSPLWKVTRQYRLTCNVSRYCLSALHSKAVVGLRNGQSTHQLHNWTLCRCVWCICKLRVSVHFPTFFSCETLSGM